MNEQKYKDLITNLRIQRNQLNKRVLQLEGALKEVDALRHKLKDGEDITRALKKPCMVLYR